MDSKTILIDVLSDNGHRLDTITFDMSCGESLEELRQELIDTDEYPQGILLQPVFDTFSINWGTEQ